MTPPETNIKTQLAELVSNAFEAFCDDISGMFGEDMGSNSSDGSSQTVRGIHKNFKKLSAIVTVKARGILSGDFYILYDREALFTLAGTIVMLPEERIKTFRKTGTLQDAQELHDAVGETGNLLVGSWDRIFREDLEGHEHFLQTNTFIGDPWDDPNRHLGLSEDEEFLYVSCEMSVGSFGAFQCGVVFPEVLFNRPDTAAGSEDDSQAIEENAPASAPETNESILPETPPELSRQATEDIENPERDTSEMPETESPTPPASDEDAQAGPDAVFESKSHTGGSVSQTIQEMVQAMPILPKEQAQALLSVPAKDIMKRQVLWTAPDESVHQVLEKMQQAGTGCTLIGSPDRLEGIVTWIDIAEAISIYLRPVFSKWRRPADDATLHIKIKIVMTRPVRTIHALTPLSAILEEMCRHRIRCLPVVDHQGHIQGVVTGADIFEALLRTDSNFSMPHPSPQGNTEQAG